MAKKTSEPIRLYTFANNPFGAKVYWALVFKQADFEITNVNLITAKEIKFSNQSTVPVLKVGAQADRVERVKLGDNTQGR